MFVVVVVAYLFHLIICHLSAYKMELFLMLSMSDKVTIIKHNIFKVTNAFGSRLISRMTHTTS